MKFTYTELFKCGAMYKPVVTREIDLTGDYETAFAVLGYKKHGDGKWFKRTAWNYCETIEVK